MRRLILGTVGVLIAFVASSLALGAGLVAEAVWTPARTSVALFDMLAWVFASGVDGTTGQLLIMSARAIWSALVTVCLVPVTLVAVLAEVVQARSLLVVAGGTGLLTAALPVLLQAGHGTARSESVPAGEVRLTALLFLTGAVAGLVYGLVGGVRREVA